MKHLVIALIALILIVVVGGGVFVTVWNIPAPRQQVETTIPNERFFDS